MVNRKRCRIVRRLDANLNATQIELLAAVLSGSHRRVSLALITDVYPVVSIEETMSGTIEIESISIITMIFETPLMSGTMEIEELTLASVVIEHSETEESMTGIIEIEELTLESITIISLEENEETMAGTIEIEELTLAEILIPYSENEEPMTGAIEIEEITLTTA